MTRMVQCVKLGREAEGLANQTWPGDLGRRIFEEVSLEAWQEWLRQQTILINEYRLNPRDSKDKKYLTEQMEAYFFGDGIVMPDQWQPDDS